MHNFDDSLPEGEKEESKLDCFFAKWYEIKPVGMNKQRDGIDREWKCRKTKREFSVEYKADSKAAETGNVFIETVSVDTTGKPGWAYTSKAQLLVYFIPPDSTAYITPMTTIKTLLPDWIDAYREVSVPNGDGVTVKYNTKGLLVPLGDFKRQCEPKIVRVHCD